MTILTEPLLPPPALTWFVQQADQHRRVAPITAGIVGRQAMLGWLDRVRAVARRVVRVVRRWAVVAPISLSAAVCWIQERAAVHRSAGAYSLLSRGGGDS